MGLLIVWLAGKAMIIMKRVAPMMTTGVLGGGGGGRGERRRMRVARHTWGASSCCLIRRRWPRTPASLVSVAGIDCHPGGRGVVPLARGEGAR